MNRNIKKTLVPILIAAALIAVALITVFAVIRPLNAQSEAMQTALEAIAAATPTPEPTPTPTPEPTPEPPWARQIMRVFGAGEKVASRVEERDPEGRLLAEVSERDGDWEYEYDAQGLLIKASKFRTVNGERSVSSWKEYRYNADGKELEYWSYSQGVDGEAILSEYFTRTYDEHGNMLRHEKSNPRDGLYEWEDVTYTYDDAGRILKSVLVNTHVSEGSYTETEINTYDEAGNLLDCREQVVSRNEWVSGYSSRTTYEYNERGQLVKETEYWNGRSDGYRLFEYDERGLRVKYADYENNNNLKGYTVHERDEAGEIRKSSDYSPGGSLKSFTVYDENGELLGKDVLVEYDDAGRPVSVIDEDEKSLVRERVAFEYDNKGRLLRKAYYWNDPHKNEQLRYTEEFEYVY